MEAWLSSAKTDRAWFLIECACDFDLLIHLGFRLWSFKGNLYAKLFPACSAPFYRLPELMLKAFGNDRNIDFPSATEPEPEPDPPSLGLSVPEALLPDEPQAASRLAVSMRIRANTESFS